VSFSTTPTG
jgi:hypothetical protein